MVVDEEEEAAPLVVADTEESTVEATGTVSVVKLPGKLVVLVSKTLEASSVLEAVVGREMVEDPAVT